MSIKESKVKHDEMRLNLLFASGRVTVTQLNKKNSEESWIRPCEVCDRLGRKK